MYSIYKAHNIKVCSKAPSTVRKQILKIIQSLKKHINVVEFFVVSKATNHWTAQPSGKVVLVETDSITVVSYIKRQGGTHPRPMLQSLAPVESLHKTRHLLDASACPRDSES